jgi:hypothetical protein
MSAAMENSRRLRDRRDYSGEASPRKCVAERFSITWNHVIEKKSLNINKLEHVRIEKVAQLFRDMLWRATELLFDARNYLNLRQTGGPVC